MADPARKPNQKAGGGRSSHALDDRWAPSQTIFDSELYAVLSALIDGALAYASSPLGRQGDDRVVETVLRRAGLSEAQERVFDLILDGRSERDVAHTLDLSRATVRTHTGRALEKVRAYINELSQRGPARSVDAT